MLVVSVIIYEAPAALADHAGDKEIWSATLTVPVSGGCINVIPGSECSSASVLTDDDVSHVGVDYAVISLIPVANRFGFYLDKAIPVAIRSAGTLYVDGSPFRLEDATFHQNNTGAEWTNHGLSWSAGDTVEVRLTVRPYYGVEISGGDLNTSGGSHYLALPTEDSSATFQIRLTADRGTATTVNLGTMVQNAPYGAPGHDWNSAAVTITPKTVTFTGGSSGNWNTFQTVTVTGVPDGDQTPEQLIILALPDPLISGANINGFHVTVADGPGVSGSSGGALPESAQLPVIILAGSADMIVPLNSAWTDPGYTATDSDGNDLTASVTISGAVDTTQAATYLLYYQVADAYGTPATPQTRTVHVIAPEPQQQTQQPQPQPQQTQEPQPEPEPEPEQEPTQEPQQEPEQEPTQEPEQEPEQTQEPEQEPTQEPEQEPEQTQEPEQEPEGTESGEQPTCDIPAIVRQYDADGSCKIEQGEWLVAVADYAADPPKLTTPQIQQIAAHRG